jgi:four helix bundle protein
MLDLKHKKLEVYQSSRLLLIEVYRLLPLLPDDEKFNMRYQLQKATLSVKLNLAEGASRKSAIERKRFYEISRGSLIEMDAILRQRLTLPIFLIQPYQVLIRY